MKALVLGNLNYHLLQALQKAGVEYSAYNPLELYLYVSESINGYDRVYDGRAELDKPERLKIKDYDFIVPRLSGQLEYRTVILEHINANLGVYSPQTATALKTASNKILTTLKLSQAGIRTPKTVWAKAPIHPEYIIKNMLDGLPIVVKTVHGSQGAGVSILETQLSANTTLESFHKCEIDVKMQRYIDGGFKDIRAIVVGDKVVCSMERTANKGDFRANLSKSGSGRSIELSKEDQEICIEANKAVGLEHSGVDLMKDKDGTTFAIEVNGNPGTKIIDVTGVNFFEHLIEHCIRKAGGKPKQSAESDGKSSQAAPPAVKQTPAFFSETDQALADLKAGKKISERWS